MIDNFCIFGIQNKLEVQSKDYQEDYFLTDLRFVNGVKLNDRKNEQWIKIDQDFWLVASYEKHGEFITSIRQSKQKLSGDDLLPELESNCKYIEICKGDDMFKNQTFQVKDYDNEKLPILIAEMNRDYPIVNLKQVDHLKKHDKGFELNDKKVIIKIYKKKHPSEVAYKPQLIDVFPLQQPQLFESYANKAFPEYLKIIDTKQPPENQYYIFTNNIEGNYSYGYCLQFWEKASITQISLLKYFVKKHQIYFPKVICILSKHKYADQFQWFLNRIYQIYSDQANKINLEHYIIGLLSIQLPQPPASLYYVYQGGDLRFHQNQHYPLLSKNSLQRVFHQIEIQKIIHIYRSLLYEERIQFISKNYSSPYYFIDTFSSLLFPFEFNGNKISILPEDNFIHLNQLQPYMIGYKERIPLPIQPQSDHVIVYTDRNIVNVYQAQIPLPQSLMDQIMQLSQFNNVVLDKNELSNSEVLKIKDIFLRFNLKLIKMCESSNLKQSEQPFIQQFKKSLMYRWLFEDRKNHQVQSIQNECYVQYPDKFSFIDQCMKKLDHEPLYQSDGCDEVFEIKEIQFLKLKKYIYSTFPTFTPYIEGEIFQTERWSEIIMAQIMELWFTFFIIYIRLKSNNLKNTKILEYAIVIVDKAINKKIKLNPIIFIYLLEAQNIYKYQCHEWLPFILNIIKYSGHQIDTQIHQYQNQKYPNHIQNDLCIIQEVDNLSLYFKAECKQCRKELEIENIVDQFERTYLESKIICQCKQEIDAQLILFEYNQDSDTQRQNQFKKQDRFLNPLYLMRQLELIINDKGHEYIISEQFTQEHHQIFHNIVAYFRLIRLKQFFLWDNEFFDSNIVKLSDGNQSYFNKRRNQKERDTFRTSMEEQFIQQADMSPSGSQCSSGQKQSENSYKDFRRFLNEYLNEPETKKIMIEKQYSHRSKQ